MKRLLNILLLFAFGLSVLPSCLDITNDREYQEYLREQEIERKKQVAQYRIDSTLIQKHLSENGLEAQIDSLSGIFYHIVEPGNKIRPTTEAQITVNYKGSLLDGTVFDKSKEGVPSEYYLGELLVGWQIGLQKIGSSGKIILYLPSYYGYGSSSNSVIPENSVLVFEIELLMYYYR